MYSDSYKEPELNVFLCPQLEEDEKSSLLVEAERFPALCQQLQMTCRTPVHGKAATFTKVCSFSIQKDAWVDHVWCANTYLYANFTSMGAPVHS